MSVCVLALLLGGVKAQTSWTSLGQWPGRGSAQYITYDSTRDRLVGWLPFGTWEYDGAAWMQVSSGPPANGPDALAYDPVRQRTVFLNYLQTWEWDGAIWTLQSNSTPLVESITFHTGRGRLMAFGGPGSNGHPGSDLMEWDGTTWNLVPTTNAPPRQGPLSHTDVIYSNLCYDQARDRLCIFGQFLLSGTTMQPQAVTWEWDIVNGWQLRNVGGLAESWMASVYDLRRSRMVALSQGSIGNSVVHVSEWDGVGSWQTLAIAGQRPPGFLLPAYDSQRGDNLAFDGNGVLWAYGPNVGARYDIHGAGCPGPLGVPTLSPSQPWTLPWLGDSLSVRLDGLPVAIVVMSTGFSDQAFGATALPLDLTAFGMPGCMLRAAPEVNVLVAGSGSAATYTLAVPQALQPQLLGLQFFQQALVPTPGSNAIGVTSNSMRGVVGAR